MKICILMDDYLPTSVKVGAKMMHELAVELKSKGHEVCVVTPASNLSTKVKIDVLDGIKIYRFNSGEIKNVGKIKRAINESLLPYRAWKSCKQIFREEKQDLIIYYSPTIFWGPLVKRLKLLWNAKSYLILRDIFPQWVIDNGMISKNSLIAKYFTYFEKINYKVADVIGVMSERNLEWFKRTYNYSSKKVEVLYNWIKLTPNKTPFNKYRKELNLEDKVVYFYGGNLGKAQDMKNIIRLAKNIRNIPQIHFLIVGEGDEEEIIKSKIKEYNLNNVTILPPVSQKIYFQMLSEFDVGLISLNKYHTTHNFPGKLLGYMSYKKPILGSINFNNDLKEIIEEYNAGLISFNGDDEAFYKNALKLVDKQIRQEFGKNAYNLVKERFSIENAVEKIINSFNNK